MKKKFLIFCYMFFLTVLFAQNTIYSKSFDLDDIYEIKINLTSETVELIDYYSSEVLVEVKSNDLNRTPDIRVVNGKLEIQNSFKRSRLGYSCDVLVYIPHDNSLEKIDVNLLSGSIKADSIYAEQIILETKSGSINGNHLDAVDLSVSAASGSINLRDISLDYFDVKAMSGSINLELIDAPIATSYISALSGSINLYIPRDADYDLRVNTLSGSFIDEITGFRGNHCDFEKKYGDGGALIDLKTTSGSVRLKEF